MGGSAHGPPLCSSFPVAAKAVQRFESGGDGSSGRSAPRQRLLLLEVTGKKVSVCSRPGWGAGVLTSLTLTPSLATAADLQLGSRPGRSAGPSSDPPRPVAECTGPPHLLPAQPEARALPSLRPVGLSCARRKGTYRLAPTARSGHRVAGSGKPGKGDRPGTEMVEEEAMMWEERFKVKRA